MKRQERLKKTGGVDDAVETSSYYVQLGRGAESGALT